MKEPQIFFRDMVAEALSNFLQIQTPVALTNQSSACLVVAQLYDKNMQIQKKADFSIYCKVGPSFL